MDTSKNLAKPDSRIRPWLSALAKVVGIPFVILLILAILIHFFLPHKRIRSTLSHLWEGRLIGNATQQFFLTTGKTTASFTYNPKTGVITGDIEPWVTSIGKNLKIENLPIESGNMKAFSITYPKYYKGYSVPFLQGPKVWFSDEGKPDPNPSGP